MSKLEYYFLPWLNVIKDMTLDYYKELSYADELEVHREFVDWYKENVL